MKNVQVIQFAIPKGYTCPCGKVVNYCHLLSNKKFPTIDSDGLVFISLFDFYLLSCNIMHPSYFLGAMTVILQFEKLIKYLNKYMKSIYSCHIIRLHNNKIEIELGGEKIKLFVFHILSSFHKNNVEIICYINT